MSKTCTFSGGNSAQTVATVTYEGSGDSAQMVGYTVDKGDAKYPASNGDMEFSIMVSDSGELETAMAMLKGSLTEVFACAVGGGPGGNNFQWLNADNNTNSSDNCKLSCS